MWLGPWDLCTSALLCPSRIGIGFRMVLSLDMHMKTLVYVTTKHLYVLIPDEDMQISS
jgi:hypothetical protein